MALDDLYIEAGNFLDGAPIENQGQADAIGVILSTAKKIKKDMDEARAEEKRPHDEAAKAVQLKWKPLLDRCDAIGMAAKAPLTDYLNKLAEEQREAERIAREEAARAAQEAIEAERASVGNLAAQEVTRQLQRAADTLARDAARAGKAKAHVAGADRALGLRTYTIAVVTDRRALLEHVMRNDPDALADWLNTYATKALPTQLPGVTIEHERKVA
jgi:hypothetical protein